MQRKQKLLILMVVVGLALGLSACGTTTPAASQAATSSAQAGASSSPAVTTGVTTVKFENGFTGPDRPSVEALVKKFNDTHPNIQVQMDISPWDSLYQKLPTAFGAGQGPDVIGVETDHIPQYASKGFLLDLSSSYTAANDLDPNNFPPGVTDVLKYQGKYYGVPMSYYPLGLYYNKDMFQKAGVDPAQAFQSQETWIAAIKKLTNKSEKIYGLAIGEHETIPNWPIFIWMNGGDYVRDGKSALTDPKTVAGLKLWSDLIKNDQISPVGLTGADVDKLFQTQKAAMEISGPWLTSGFDKAGLNYDVARMPPGPAGRVTYGGAVALMVNNKSKVSDAALEFAKFWNSKDGQISWSTTSGFPSARLDLTADPAIAASKWVPKFAQLVPDGRFLLAGQEKFAQIQAEVLTPMIQEITLGRKSVEDATSEADQKLNALLGP